MYTLLTGATGMLGRYLLRDMLVRGWDLALLVRPGRRESAAQKIEKVLSYWEESWNCSLPRPLVFEGNIVEEGLGLDSATRQWLKVHCGAVLHSAASLTFYEEDEEPWLSNVQGVRNVLDLCQELSIRKFYHVSTAYTCGLRTGPIFEDELDVGQEFGNDYERSKVQAEKLIRQSSWLDVAVVFRPSIIVGDSQTGYSSTFHGFYTPLRLICALRSQLSHEQLFQTDFMSAMGLEGDEGKNFVPVDWVSQAMANILERRPEASQTYAITSTSPVTTARMMDTLRKVSQNLPALTRATGPSHAQAPEVQPSEAVLQAYQQQLQTYRSYWRNDPLFDCTHTQAVLADLPCPVVTDAMLQRLSEWAIRMRFAAPRPSLTATPTFQIAQTGTQPLYDWDAAHARVLQISGTGGGSWTLEISPQTGRLQCVAGRLADLPHLCVGSHVFARIADQQLSLDAAVKSGQVVLVGPPVSVASWATLIQAVVADACIPALEPSKLPS